MKILLVNYWPIPRLGGTNRHLQVLKEGLVALGHQVDILAPAPGKKEAHQPASLYLTDGSQVVNLEPIANWLRDGVLRQYQRTALQTNGGIAFREQSRYTFELASSLFKLDTYDVIHAHDVVTARTMARVRPAGVGLVATIHGSLTAEGLVQGVLKQGTPLWTYARAEERLGVTAADRTLMPTEWMRQYLTELHHLPPEAIRVVPYGLQWRTPAEGGQPAPGSIPPTGGRRVILCPARLTAEKGHTHLLAALAMLRQKRADFVCWIAGDGSLRPALEKQARDSGLGDAVVFLGNRADVPGLLAQADAVVLPSVHDNMPYAVIEAQLAARPVVASRVGGLPDMIQDGVTGLLTPPEDAAALASRLDLLLTEPERGRRIGKRAAAWGRTHWDSRRMVRSVLALYREAHRLAAHRGAAAGGQARIRNTLPGSVLNAAIGAPAPPVWHQILQHLPGNYSIPDRALISALAPEVAEEQLWRQAVESLPARHQIPDPDFLAEMQAWSRQ